MHTVCDLGEELWRNARAKLGPRYWIRDPRSVTTLYLTLGYDAMTVFVSLAVVSFDGRGDNRFRVTPTLRLVAPALTEPLPKSKVYTAME